MIPFKLKDIKTKQQLASIVNQIKTGDINIWSSTRVNQQRLKWCLTHLRRRDVRNDDDVLVICDLLRLLYDHSDDNVNREIILMITSMASRMQEKLTKYSKESK